MIKGLVIGKFYPFHKGHQYLVEKGLENCDELYMIICYKKEERPTGEMRYNWVKELYPKVKVSLFEDIKNDPNDSKLWAELTVKHLNFIPDIVFTSENYGDLYCQYLNCKHYMVDLKRVNVHVCGSLIRENPYNYWDYISEPLKEYYTSRIIIMGPESTGKTTLCQKLSNKYQTNWVPEYGREYSESKIIKSSDKIEYEWSSQDFMNIAMKQNKLENEYARKSNKLLFCDTNSFATYIWHIRYMGKENSFLLKLSFYHKRPDLILVTKPDVPFVQDGTRDGELIRDNMYQEFISQLDKFGYQYKILDGNYDERYNKAIKLINDYLQVKFYK